MSNQSTADLIRGVAAGTSDLDTSGNGSGMEEGILNASDSTMDGDTSEHVENESNHEESEEIVSKSSEKAPVKQASPSEGVITISDDKGRRQVKVDYNNKEQINKYVQMAYGMRKFQAERDAAIAESSPVKAQLEEMRSNWDTLESAFEGKGIEGVIDLLEGKQGAYKAHLSKAMERQKFLERASPEELEALEAREVAQSKSSENDKLRKEFEALKASVAAAKDQSEVSSVESRIHPAFDKYRFADKLGDATDEAMFDQMLWRTAMDRLSPYEEQYGSASAIPQEVIDREFRAVSSSLRKRISVQAEKKAERVISQKKQEATENVQAKVQSGYKTGGIRKEADKYIEDRNLTGLLKNWGKFGSAFSKK